MNTRCRRSDSAAMGREGKQPEVRQCSDGQGGEAKRIYEVDLHQHSTKITLEQNEPFFACELAFSMPDEEGMAERDIDDGDGWQEPGGSRCVLRGGGNERCVSPFWKKEVMSEVFNTAKKLKF